MRYLINTKPRWPQHAFFMLSLTNSSPDTELQWCKCHKM